jgi:hypothetical protein
MDPILRTGLDWLRDEARASVPLAEIQPDLEELRDKLDKLPSNLFFLASPDEPYALHDILAEMGKQALAWQSDPQKAVERKLLAPQVEEILQKAIQLRERLDAVSQCGPAEGQLRLPLGAIRRSMERRGEALPDRI